MKITDIKQQVKRQGRYSIYVDEKYSFSLSEGELLDIGIRIGQEYTAEEFEELKKKALLDKAFMRAYDQLSRRARSEWELRDYLKRKEYEPEVIDAIIEVLVEKGHIDDAKFAESWVRNRRLLKPMSKMRLRQELRQKRVADEVIFIALEEDEGSETDILKDLVNRKRQQTRYQDDIKLKQYLLRQGFRYDEIQTAMKENDDE
jgi:regulatory protein